MPSGTPGSLPPRSANTRSLCLARTPLVGKLARAVGFHHHIVWAVEPPPLKAVRQNRETAVELAPRHASSVVLTCEEPPLQIAREPVRAVGRLEIDGHAIARRVFHAPIVVDIGEQEVAALLPPERPLGGAHPAAAARCQ